MSEPKPLTWEIVHSSFDNQDYPFKGVVIGEADVINDLRFAIDWLKQKIAIESVCIEEGEDWQHDILGQYTCTCDIYFKIIDEAFAPLVQTPSGESRDRLSGNNKDTNSSPNFVYHTPAPSQSKKKEVDK